MRIVCPFCGSRSHAEFTYGEDAVPVRPPGDAGPEAFNAYLYDRENPPGIGEEYWHHTAGCRQWLIVRRNMTTHEILAVRPAQPWPASNQEGEADGD